MLLVQRLLQPLRVRLALCQLLGLWHGGGRPEGYPWPSPDDACNGVGSGVWGAGVRLGRGGGGAGAVAEAVERQCVVGCWRAKAAGWPLGADRSG